MSRNCLPVALAALSFVVQAAMSFAVVTGVVKDTAGTPIAGAIVTLTDESNTKNTFSGTTDNQGKYSINIAGAIGVAESAPSVFSLGQNYPNPFNPSTVIPFSLSAPTRVSLSIYNIMGQKVCTVFDRHMNAGLHSVTWNGLNDRGNHVSAGVYLYRLQAGANSVTKKMLLLDGGEGSHAAKPLLKTGAQLTAKTAAGATYTIVVTRTGTVIYRNTGVVIVDGQALDYTISLPGGTFVIKSIPLTKIQSGTFQMGSEGELASSQPVHQVTVTAFTMSVCEITQGQYAALTGLRPSNFTGDDNLPVEMVTWFDAIRFCNKLSDAAGLDRCYTDEFKGVCDFSKNGFRLPTEAEWEIACRAGTTTAFYFGDNQSDLTYNGWFTSNSKFSTHPVGLKTANPWGLYDMHGNVSEWCNDWYDKYSEASLTDPTGPATDVNAARVTRGGRYDSSAGDCTSARRGYKSPGEKGKYWGFRVVSRP